MKKLVLTLALLLPVTAQAADSGYAGASWLTPNRQIQLWYKVNVDRGFDVTVVGIDNDNPAIQLIVLQVGSKTIGSCNNKLCTLTWKRPDMQLSVNTVMVTVTNAVGQRFGMPARIARP